MSSGIVEPSSSSQQVNQQQQQQAVSRSRLVQRLLATSANLPAFLHDLLHTQAVTVAGTEAAAFLIERGPEDKFGLRPIAHIRPDDSDADTRAAAIAAFQELIHPCVAQNKDGAIEVGGGGDAEPQFCLVTLLRSDGEVVAASAVITRCRDVERAQQRLQSMLLVAGYFDLYTLRRTSEQSRAIAQSHQHVLQLATSVAIAEGFKAAATGLCNELAARTGATRVSLGWVKGIKIKVKALSHTEQFDKKQELIVHLERVMEECMDQEDVVHYEPDGTASQNVTREAQEFSRTHGGNTIISVPLRRKAEVVGVLTLEFTGGQKLGPQAASGLSVAADLLAPQLYDRHENDRWLITKTAISTRELIKATIGPKYWIAKLVATTLLLVILVICNAIPLVDLRIPYRVSAKFAFAPIERRFIHAPFEGHIEEVHVRPGDQVTAGETVLFTLNTRELEWELATARYRAEEAEREYVMYIGDGKNAEANMAMARKRAEDAKAKYLEEQISRAVIKAEIDGYVLEGDLTQKVGAPTRLGDQLMIVGRRDLLRGELRVAERDVQNIREGFTGKLATTSLPTEKYQFVVDRIIPETEPQSGDNYFRVWVTLEEAAPHWLPGMEGEARIDVRKEPIIWVWTHRLVDFVRLKLWI